MNPFIETLGWTLIHFLWQATLVAGALWISLRFIGAARWRYLISCCSLVALLGCAAVSMGIHWPQGNLSTLGRIQVASPANSLDMEKEENSVVTITA